MSKVALWVISVVSSVLLAINLLGMWRTMDDYDADTSAQIIDVSGVEDALQEYSNAQLNLAEATKIPTGIFIQSLKFFNSSEVNMTGYIWQHYPIEQHRGISNDDLKPGFIFPEEVNTAGEGLVKLAYRRTNCISTGGESVSDGQGAGCESEVIGWYFETTLKQAFDYSTYPFDHKTVWIRIWPDEFSGNVVLVPDFDAYDSTAKEAIFGIEKSIVLGAWSRENTFFDYKVAKYDTNFGIQNYIGQQGYPELHYNFVIKRRFDDAFIIYVLPLFLVSVLLFAAMLTITECPKENELLGFNTSGFLGMCSALFFVVLIAHIQLREQFAGSTVVYLEYFYILMYTLLVGATINAYLFSIRPKYISSIVTYKNNIIPKVTFWPFILIVLNVVTFQVMR